MNVLLDLSEVTDLMHLFMHATVSNQGQIEISLHLNIIRFNLLIFGNYFGAPIYSKYIESTLKRIKFLLLETNKLLLDVYYGPHIFIFLYFLFPIPPSPPPPLPLSHSLALIDSSSTTALFLSSWRRKDT